MHLVRISGGLYPEAFKSGILKIAVRNFKMHGVGTIRLKNRTPRPSVDGTWAFHSFNLQFSALESILTFGYTFLMFLLTN